MQSRAGEAMRPPFTCFLAGCSRLARRGKGTCFAYGQTGSGKTYTMQVSAAR